MPKRVAEPLEDVLGRLPMFEQVAAARLRGLARQAQVIRCAKNTRLYERGDATAGCHVLLRGLVTLSTRGPGGAEKVLRLVLPGEAFGESVLFDAQQQPVSAQVLLDSELVLLPAAAMLRLVERDRAFARTLLRNLARRVHVLIADIESYALNTGGQRLAAYLCAQAPGGGPARVHLPANKSVIASRLGIAKETLSRLLHEFTAQGMIEVHQRDIVLCDRPRLDGLAQGAGARAAGAAGVSRASSGRPRR